MNERQFSSVASTYHYVRPMLPKEAVNLVQQYYGAKLQTVVDLGCGSGLSTLPWKEAAAKVIGIDPGKEMLTLAKAFDFPGVAFRQAFGHDTGLANESADAVVCSQSFHWMEPESTLKEVGRILKQGGVFAAIDYDWPPLSSEKVEHCFNELYAIAKDIVQKSEKEERTFTRWDKKKHLVRMEESGVFSAVEETVFLAKEPCTAERLYRMALSQSWIDIALKQQPEIMEPLLRNYRKVIERENGEEFTVSFRYRMRIGKK